MRWTRFLTCFSYFQPELCFALLLTYLWIIYITFYNSRIIGYLVTKLVNRFYFRAAYFKIGNVDFRRMLSHKLIDDSF